MWSAFRYWTPSLAVWGFNGLDANLFSNRNSSGSLWRRAHLIKWNPNRNYCICASIRLRWLPHEMWIRWLIKHKDTVDWGDYVIIFPCLQAPRNQSAPNCDVVRVRCVIYRWFCGRRHVWTSCSALARSSGRLKTIHNQEVGLFFLNLPITTSSSSHFRNSIICHSLYGSCLTLKLLMFEVLLTQIHWKY